MKKIILVLLLFSPILNLFAHGGDSSKKLVSKNVITFDKEDNFTEVIIEMNNWDFSLDNIVLKKGEKYRLTFITKSGHHGVNIPKLDFKSPNLELNESSSFDMHANAVGEYKFFCHIPCGKGHREMVGKIIVK